jgi:hypothetical protein
MSYYDPQSPASWQQTQRQGWDPRSAATTPTALVPYAPKDMGSAQDLTTRFTQMKPEDLSAFGSQLDGTRIPTRGNLLKECEKFRN